MVWTTSKVICTFWSDLHGVAWSCWRGWCRLDLAGVVETELVDGWTAGSKDDLQTRRTFLAGTSSRISGDRSSVSTCAESPTLNYPSFNEFCQQLFHSFIIKCQYRRNFMLDCFYARIDLVDVSEPQQPHRLHIQQVDTNL